MLLKINLGGKEQRDSYVLVDNSDYWSYNFDYYCDPRNFIILFSNGFFSFQNISFL